MKRQSSKQSGFTLVEIAIVLVIVGLLLGGVLKGQELITSSKGKALDNDKAGIQAAFTSYSDRYKALAGDDAQVAARFTPAQCGGAPCIPGNGNNLIAGQGNFGWALATGVAIAAAPTVAQEGVLAWQHLRAAGFMKDGENNPTATLGIFSYPRHAANGRLGVQAVQLFVGQQATTPSQLYIFIENVPTNVAQSLDSSVDDGFVNLGQIRGSANGVAAAPNVNAGASYALGVNGAGLANAAPTNLASYNLSAALF